MIVDLGTTTINYGETWTFVLWIDDAAVGVLPVTTPLIPVAVLITGGSMELKCTCCFPQMFWFFLVQIGSLILISLSFAFA